MPGASRAVRDSSACRNTARSSWRRCSRSSRNICADWMLTAMSGATSSNRSRSDWSKSPLRLLMAWNTPMGRSSTIKGMDSELRAPNMFTKRRINRGSWGASLEM